MLLRLSAFSVLDNNTDIKNTEFSDTDSIFPSGNGGMMDENDRYQEYFDYFSDQLSMDLLKKDYGNLSNTKRCS